MTQHIDHETVVLKEAVAAPLVSSMATSSYGSAPCLCSWCSASLFQCTSGMKSAFYDEEIIANSLQRAPTSGGQYHWVSMLAPKSSQKLLSYISGV